MTYSLQSRDLIADQVETAAGGHWLDGTVVIPGCDKNMPGTLIALGRLNRPGLMVYGGTIRPGQCGGGADGRPKEVLDIVSAFQSYGRFLQEGQTEEAEKIRYETVRNACPGAGACGGVSHNLKSSMSVVPLTILDVHRQHNGVGYRGLGYGSPRFLLLPGRIPREIRRMRLCRLVHAQPSREEHLAS